MAKSNNNTNKAKKNLPNKNKTLVWNNNKYRQCWTILFQHANAQTTFSALKTYKHRARCLTKSGNVEDHTYRKHFNLLKKTLITDVVGA